jgi:tryptophan 2,3-dioxygenase
LTAYDIELSDCEPVLATIDCFKELGVYGQLYECLEDLVEYFDSDRQWRYGYN